MRTVYLDNNATAATSPEVVEAMAPFWTERYGNPSSAHSFGGNVRREVEAAREKVASLLCARPEEIVFTAGGSESDNAAIRGAMEVLEGRKRHLVTTRVEHPAVLSVSQYLERRGASVTRLPVDGSGALDLDLLEKSITPQTALVSAMWANNETGVLFPVDRIAELCRARGVLFHTDAVQAAGKVPIDLGKLPIDLLSLSGHKLHGPKGVGVLYVRKGTRLSPFILGGHQEGGRRAGTENVPAIVGLGVACRLAAGHLDEDGSRVRALRDRLESRILASCPGAFVNGANRLPNTLNVSFEFIEGESVLLMLDEVGVCASSGSACTSGSLEPSHVMRAMGVPFTRAHGSIRFSLSRYTTQEEIDYVADRLPPIVKRLRELSPFVPR
ncbi:MAG: cysteine desulfurase NifS [Planctomycetes bacterium]|jgi:cysteine desulfurase|nr:cysteine desulfurase NifS [Planctomycetota bacterium]